MNQKLNRKSVKKPIEELELIRDIFTMIEQKTGKRPKDFEDYKANFQGISLI